jgi:AbrB family looped-hinge helix DNA binding protein
MKIRNKSRSGTTKVNVKYQVVIPKEVREVVNIEPNEVWGVFSDGEKRIVLEKIPKSFKDLWGTYKFPKDYLKKERESWDKPRW